MLKVGDGLGLEDAVNQFLHDDAIDLLALRCLGAHVLDAVRHEFFRVDAAFDEPTCAGESEAPESARCSPCGDSIGDMQPLQR